MVFYRKYRPQSLDELIGQDNVKQILKNAYLNNRLAHAYLFCGPKGTGKTSTARILAKMINCENQSSAISSQLSDEKQKQSDDRRLKTDDLSIPCNNCSSCLSITDGSNLDLIEIDAASNRGIDDIRELRDKVKLAPTASKKKVYIIDEVHMLTNEAFNALLKTLEEPPSHVVFVLATTEVHKLPQTILSRVQKLDFQQATKDQILEALQRVVKEEKIEIDDQALDSIARKSDGSFRDSLKILDQVTSSGAEKISAKDIEKLFKDAGISGVTPLLEAIFKKDSKNGLEIIGQQVTLGNNIREYTSTAIGLLRTMLLLKNGVVEVAKKDSGGDFEVINALAGKFTNEKIIQTLQLFLESLEQLKYASITSLPLEIAVVEACLETRDKKQETSDLKASVQNSTVVIPTNVEGSDTTHSQVLRDSSTPFHSARNDKKEEINKIATSPSAPRNDIVESGEAPDDVKLPDNSEADMAKLLDKWTYILETIKPYNYSLEALLKQVKVLSCNKGQVMLEVPYSFHQRILEAPKSRSLLESVLSDVLGQSARVNCKLGRRPVRVEEIANVELAADDEVIKIAAEIFNSDTIN